MYFQHFHSEVIMERVVLFSVATVLGAYTDKSIITLFSIAVKTTVILLYCTKLTEIFCIKPIKKLCYFYFSHKYAANDKKEYKILLKPPWCSGIVAGFRTKGLEFKTIEKRRGIRQERPLEFKVLCCSSNIWFESECVVATNIESARLSLQNAGKMM